MLRSLLLLFAVLSAAVLSLSCGPNCSAATCSGCCDATGACQLGSTNNACGSSGAACRVCSGGSSCQIGTCATTAISGGTGGGANQQPPGCQSTDRNLSLGTASPGLTLLSLGSIPVTQATTFLATPAFESAPVALCLPNDVVSVALFAGNTFPSSWRSNGVEVMTTGSLDELIRWVTPEFTLPKSPNVSLQPGRHEFKLVSNVRETAAPVLAIRRGPRSNSSKFRLNLIFVAGAGLTQAEVDSIQTNSTVFDNLYASAGVAVLEARGGNVTNPDYAVVTSGSYGGLLAQPVTPTAEPMFTDAVNLYLVRQINSSDAAGSLLGQSIGIPGAPGVSGKGAVIVSLDAHRLGGTLQASALWATVAHEVGHWHGLRHTTERTGRTFDVVGDTPECDVSRDVNGDGLLRMDECASYGANNMMFWTYDISAPPTVISAGQAYALHSALTVVPR